MIFMDQSNKCIICQGKGRRACPALEGQICPSCCGAKRGSDVQCTSECPHFPFGINGYDAWLKIDGSLIQKTTVFMASYCDRYKFEETIQKMSLGDSPQEQDLEVTAGAAVYYLLFVERDGQGETLADKWAAQKWEGLNNDERVMMNYRCHSRGTIIEIQKILDHQAMECIDLFDQKRGKFILYDRKTAGRISRFTKLFTWLTHYSHFSRAEHGGVEISEFISKEFEEIAVREAEREIKKRQGFTFKDYLSENFGSLCRLTREIAEEKRKATLNTMDFHQCRAMYDMKGGRHEIEAILEEYPEFERDDEQLKEEDPPGTQYYVWLREGKSKAIEKEMPLVFQHKGDPEKEGVGVLGNIVLYSDHMNVEAFTKQKFAFAKKMMEQYFSGLVSFKKEMIVDVAKQLAEGPREKKKLEEVEPMSPEIEKELMSKSYKNHYIKFLDDKIPALENATPREASKDEELRPKLIELMKGHIGSVEKQNKVKSLNIDIDWVLDELGLVELK